MTIFTSPHLPKGFKIVALAGGVGGAKLAYGLAQVIPSSDLTVVVNVGDDFEHYGLKICPDLDTVCYTLAGLANPQTGWGLKDDSDNALQAASALGGPGWFKLGDRDLGTHLERTRRLRLGQPLSQVTREFCKSWGITANILPATDDLVPTIVRTPQGDLSFQDYFVRQHCAPRVTGFLYLDAGSSSPAPGVKEALNEASLVIFCPSNPFVSLDPILALPEIQQSLRARRREGMAIVAVSPIIGGETVKGPAAKMFAELGIEPSALAVARHYASLLDGFVLDRVDACLVDQIAALKIQPLETNTLMTTPGERSRLGGEVVSFGLSLLQAGELTLFHQDGKMKENG